jgi:hypothetical protein
MRRVCSTLANRYRNRHRADAASLFLELNRALILIRL